MNVKWAKNVPAFTSLNLNDQVSGMPLRSRYAEMLLSYTD